jgi:hypothetical protein
MILAALIGAIAGAGLALAFVWHVDRQCGPRL